MTDSPKPLRTYDEKEIARILERATELQRSESATPSSGGMTLAELEDIATEAGIDVGLLRRAALEMDAGVAEPGVWSRLLGAEIKVIRETIVAGEVPMRALEDLVPLIQSSVSGHGQPTLMRRTLTWQGGSSQSGRTLRVVVSAREGETTIRVEEDLTQMAGGLFGGVGGGVGFGVGFGAGMPLGLAVLGSPAFALAFPAAFLGLTYMGVREAYRRIVRGRRRAVDDLFGRLVGEVQDAVASSTLEGD